MVKKVIITLLATVVSFQTTISSKGNEEIQKATRFTTTVGMNCGTREETTLKIPRSEDHQAKVSLLRISRPRSLKPKTD